MTLALVIPALLFISALCVMLRTEARCARRIGKTAHPMDAGKRR